MYLGVTVHIPVTARSDAVRTRPTEEHLFHGLIITVIAEIGVIRVGEVGHHLLERGILGHRHPERWQHHRRRLGLLC